MRANSVEEGRASRRGRIKSRGKGYAQHIGEERKDCFKRDG
jgi:hypothetical protein